MMPKYSKKQANNILETLDNVSGILLSRYAALGMSYKTAFEMAHTLDTVADDIQVSVGGPQDFKAWQEKVAQVLQRESDEPYMDTYKNPMSPHQTERDEPYMGAYEDDQSSAVIHGKSEVNGRKLAPLA